MKNLLDREPPRLGVVQVKFFGSTETAHYVHKEYVVDAQNKPRGEFFLLCHSGSEEAQQTFLITADDINANFTVSETNGGSKFYIPFKQLQPYEVKNRKFVLDRVENHLSLADFTKNRRFMSWILPSPETELDAILPDYKEPIQNQWGDIPEAFADIKGKARRALMDVEEAHDALLRIADATDPLDAEKALEELSYNCKDGYGRWRIALPDDLQDEDFFNVCKAHKTVVAQLKQDGLLDAFLDLRRGLQQQVVNFLAPHFPVDGSLVHKFVIYYDPASFELKQINSNLLPAEQQPVVSEIGTTGSAFFRDMKVIEGEAIELSAGEVQGIWIPGRWGFSPDKPDRNLETFRHFPFPIYYDCMQLAYSRRYPDEGSR